MRRGAVYYGSLATYVALHPSREQSSDIYKAKEILRGHFEPQLHNIVIQLDIKLHIKLIKLIEV